MKRITNIFFQTAIIFFFLMSFFAVQVFACNQLCVLTGSCSGTCADCDGCPEVELPEDVIGKITNRALPEKLTTMRGVVFLEKILKTGIVMTLITGSVVFFFILTSGGIKWISSSGDKVKLESAQKQISSGLVGLAILLSSFAIIKLVEVLFGIDLLEFTLPTL